MENAGYLPFAVGLSLSMSAESSSICFPRRLMLRCNSSVSSGWFAMFLSERMNWS